MQGNGSSWKCERLSHYISELDKIVTLLCARCALCTIDNIAFCTAVAVTPVVLRFVVVYCVGMQAVHFRAKL